MKTSHASLRAILCGFALATTTAITFATTINYSGSVTGATGGYASNMSWQLTVVLQDPLTDLYGGAGAGALAYNIVGATMSVDGAVRNTAQPGALPNLPLRAFFGADVGDGTGARAWGNSIYPFLFGDQNGPTGFVLLWLLASTPVTGPDGMLLPNVPMSNFSTNALQYQDTVGSIEGTVTSYTVVPSAAIPDAAWTIGMLGLGLSGVLGLGRRFAS